MFGFQDLFDDLLDQEFMSNKLAYRIFEAELEKQNLYLNNSQRKELEYQFKNLSEGSLHFDFNERQLGVAGLSEKDAERVIKKLISKLPKQVEGFLDNFDDTMSDIVDSVTDSMADSLSSSLLTGLGEILRDQHELHNRFSEDVWELWGEALSKLHALIVISEESVQEYFQSSREDKGKDSIIHVLDRLCSRAIQIAKEIIILLKSGYADGAQARWRTLHELSVVSLFISQYGADVAERYMKHNSVELYRAALQYQERCSALSMERITSFEMSQMKDSYDRLLKCYGDEYRHDNGWAAQAIGKKKPTFRDIEESVKLDHIRTFYREASAKIHANPSGVLSQLGLIKEDESTLSGPSRIGLSVPAQSTAISLNIVVNTLLSREPSVDSIVVCKVLNLFSRQVAESFVFVDEQVNEVARYEYELRNPTKRFRRSLVVRRNRLGG